MCMVQKESCHIRILLLSSFQFSSQVLWISIMLALKHSVPFSFIRKCLNQSHTRRLERWLLIDLCITRALYTPNHATKDIIIRKSLK